MTALLPCPHCGGEACEALGMCRDKPWKYAECTQCGALAELNYWNRRAPVCVDDVMAERVWSNLPDNASRADVRAALEAALRGTP